MDSIWGKSLAILKEKVTDQTYNTWFMPLREKSISETEIVLSVPNKFFSNWIQDNYLEMIKSSILIATSKEMSVVFVVEEPTGGENQNISGHSPQKVDSVPWFKSMFGTQRSVPESDLGLNSKYSFDSFVVGPSNSFAHAAALAISENPAKTYNPFFLYGGVGLGKTHLLHAIGHYVVSKKPKTKVLFISSEEFMNQLINSIKKRKTAEFRNMYRSVDVLLIDDIQFIAGKEATQEEFFHTFNKLYDSQKQIIITSDRPPKDISSLEERLVTRFSWGLIADVQIPDFETRVAILSKKSENEAVPFPEDVLYFLAEHIRTNIREMEGALIRVAAYSKLTNCPLSLDMAKEVLKGMIKEEEKKITIPLIQETVASFFNISKEEMVSKKRTRAIAYPRQIAMYVSRKLTDSSLPFIGEKFGGRDHTTVLHALDKIKNAILSDPNTEKIVDNLLLRLKDKN